MKTRIYLTVDAETSMGGAWTFPDRSPLPVSRCVFGDNGAESCGLPFITQVLKRYGLTATFFCEVLAAEVLGDREIGKVVDYIQAAGQDVQLHAHPTFHHYADFLRLGASNHRERVRNDLLCAHTPAQQRELLGNAIETFQRLTGSRPTAYRAGSYAADLTTLRILKEYDVRVDSSWNPAFPDYSFSGESLQPNQVREIEGVWELPVTTARSSHADATAYKPFEISALSNREMEFLLNTAHSRRLGHVVAVFHSFSTIKARDYTFAACRPNRITMRRFERLARFLAENAARFEVTTVGKFAGAPTSGSHSPLDNIPALPFRHSMVRKAVQAVNRWYWL